MPARSQPASVWPARISTPPSTACSGKMWPGCTRSARASRATAACTVRARSAAEMPVVTPSAASIETVKAVPILVPLRATMGGSCRRSQRSRVRVRQIRPRPKRAMKLIGFGRDVVGGQDQVALVLAVFLVDQDHHAAGADVGHDLFDRGDGRGCAGVQWA
jgi:hypothetical protein